VSTGDYYMPIVYLASPLGFSPESQGYLDKVKSALVNQGCTVFDPWEQKQFLPKIAAAFEIQAFPERVSAFRRISSAIGGCNEDGIRGADIVFAVLDGAEIDSGTASEIGFGSALGKKCYGLRTDLRDTGDFVGVAINLQVLHFIERTGGTLFRRIDDIAIAL
jgi:nucleoside 2-deoxyribosyltransferase